MSYYYNDNPNELYHYGVVGMKWGVRRARKRGEEYTYTSHGTKRYAKKALKARNKGDEAKAQKYERYHKRSVELDRKMQTNALSNSNKRAALKTLINGPFGNKTYEAVRAATGGSKKLSRAAAYVAAQASGPVGASVARAAYVRGIDNKSVGNRVHGAAVNAVGVAQGISDEARAKRRS